MVDTLMVIWTSGMWKRLLRNTCAFLLVGGGICALLFLLTTNSKQWSGLAATVAPSHASAQTDQSSSSDAPATAPTQATPEAYSTAQPFIQPIVLKNPVLPDSHSSQNTRKHFVRHEPAPAYNPQPAPITRPNPPVNTSNPDDPTNMLQNMP